MKKLLLLSLVSMAMVIPQIYSISVAEYIKQNGVPKIESGMLDLSRKNITDLEGLRNIPEEVRNRITILNLLGNQIQTLPAGIFSNLNNIQILDLSNNQIQTLPAGIFSNLNNIQILDLSNNRLKTLPDGIFNGLSNLEGLDLYGNPFSAEFLRTLPAILKTIPTLEYLDNKPIVEALKSYRVYQPETLQEITKEYALRKFTPEEMAKLPSDILDTLPFSARQRAGIAAYKRQLNQ